MGRGLVILVEDWVSYAQWVAARGVVVGECGGQRLRDRLSVWELRQVLCGYSISPFDEEDDDLDEALRALRGAAAVPEAGAVARLLAGVEQFVGLPRSLRLFIYRVVAALASSGERLVVDLVPIHISVKTELMRILVEAGVNVVTDVADGSVDYRCVAGECVREKRGG